MIRQVSVVVLGIVVPYVGTWIEIALSCSGWVSAAVVPYVGTWIEILHPLVMNNGAKGRSLRGNVDRNFHRNKIRVGNTRVVPYVGTWIEIHSRRASNGQNHVVPYVGTWIEIHTRIM